MKLGLCLYVVLSCVGRGLCEELILHPKESYPMSDKIQKPRKGIGKRGTRKEIGQCLIINRPLH